MSLSPRDRSLLELLDRTPATVELVHEASGGFPGGPFRDERRVRERMQALAAASLLRAFRLGIVGGGQGTYYKLTPEAFRLLHPDEADLPPRSYFAEIAPSRIEHTLELAEVIVHSLVAAHRHRVRLTKFHRENELVLEVDAHRAVPDCHLQFSLAGKTFNILVELDRSTESVVSASLTSIRTKLLAYEAYQNYVLDLWRADARRGPRPAFRVAFLTKTVERAYHILALARECARNPDRRLTYGATQPEFLSEENPLQAPIFLDHFGHWQALVDLHPSAPFTKTPVRIAPIVIPPHPL